MTTPVPSTSGPIGGTAATATGNTSADEQVPTGKQLGLYGCPTCGRVSRRAGLLQRHAEVRCPRCDTPLHHRDPVSLQRTWAYTLAAMVLYMPANFLPIMSTRTVTGSSTHTLLGGIHELWAAGDWPLALIVFIASMAVPVLKLAIMLLLTITAQRRSHWRSRDRTRLYRVVEAVGHWSMLDVFVVVMLVGMIRFGPFAGVRPEAGLLAFGAVVVLTLMAAGSFDPRLLWPEPASPMGATDGPSGAAPLAPTLRASQPTAPESENRPLPDRPVPSGSPLPAPPTARHP